MTRRGAGRREFVTRLAALLAGLAPGCTVPLVEPAGERTFGTLPDLVHVFACRTEDDVLLRGLFVEGRAGGPLVLHLLPRGASCTNGLAPFAGFRETLESLRVRGFASLVLDYRGVGASEGNVDTSALPADARAMWRAALSLVEGDERRILLRAASLGTLAAAAILADDARPAACLLIAPIDASTIVGNAMRERFGSFLGSLLGWFHEPPRVPALSTILQELGNDTWLVLPRDDPYLTSADLDELALPTSPGLRVEHVALDHQTLVLRAYGFETSESFGRVAPDLVRWEVEFLEGVFGSEGFPNGVDLDAAVSPSGQDPLGGPPHARHEEARLPEDEEPERAPASEHSQERPSHQ